MKTVTKTRLTTKQKVAVIVSSAAIIASAGVLARGMLMMPNRNALSLPKTAPKTIMPNGKIAPSVRIKTPAITPLSQPQSAPKLIKKK
ncbi:MAG: hypothetical protein V1763_01285 [Parcubacteria group bacterium]